MEYLSVFFNWFSLENIKAVLLIYFQKQFEFTKKEVLNIKIH